jgi:glycosyltransferase involved in cell wall biosynthesis
MEASIAGEVIVADNGSSDGSIEIAQRLGAQGVKVQNKGYGNALMGGIAAARGKFIVMGDADDSYDFGHIASFVEELRRGSGLSASLQPQPPFSEEFRDLMCSWP